MAQLILQVFPQNKWARGKVTNLTERSTPLGGVLVDYLGDSFKFVGRQLEVHSARDGMVLILQHQKMTTFPKPDRAKSGTYRQGKLQAAGLDSGSMVQQPPTVWLAIINSVDKPKPVCSHFYAPYRLCVTIQVTFC